MNELPAPRYDELWKSDWSDMHAFGPLNRHIRNRVYENVRRLNVRSVLDVGCGQGDVLQVLAKKTQWNLSGLDISNEALARAKMRVPSANFILADCKNSGLSEKFDLVTCIQMLEHLTDDSLALEKMRSWTGKFLYLSTMGGQMRASEGRLGHIRNYSEMDLRQLIEGAGYEIVRFERWGFPFYSPIYRTLIEIAPDAVRGEYSTKMRFLAKAVYSLYFLNSCRLGDIFNVLARVK